MRLLFKTILISVAVCALVVLPIKFTSTSHIQARGAFTETSYACGLFINVCPPADCTAGRDVGRDFFVGVVERLSDVPMSTFAVDALVAWEPYENTLACWNPLATTWNKPGSCCFNSVCVRHYLSQSMGVEATADTLALGYYNSIRSMLKKEAFDREGLRQSLSTWGSCSGAGCDSLLNTWEDLWDTDAIPPTTSRSLSGTSGENGWYTSDVQVTLTSSDNSGGSGVDHVEYKIDGGTWHNYSGPFTISGEGRHTVYYKAQDKADNWESQKQVSIPIDATAPTGSLALNDGATSTPGVLVRVNPSASDATSGVYRMRLRDAGGTWSDWRPYATQVLWQLPAVTGQSHTVEVQVKDMAGHVSAIYEDAILLDIYPVRPASSGYRLTRSTWGVAPTAGQSTNHRLLGTLGQSSLIGELSSAGYRLSSGYWGGRGRNGAAYIVYLPLVLGNR